MLDIRTRRVLCSVLDISQGGCSVVLDIRSRSWCSVVLDIRSRSWCSVVLDIRTRRVLCSVLDIRSRRVLCSVLDIRSRRVLCICCTEDAFSILFKAIHYSVPWVRTLVNWYVTWERLVCWMSERWI